MKRIISKLAALLIVGAALCATGCTKAKADDGKNNLDSEYATKADIAELNHTITELETMISGEIVGLKARVSALEAAVGK